MTFTKDWGVMLRALWPPIFEQYGLTGPGLRFLEIGCFEGRTTVWLLENVDMSSTVTVVDTFEGSPEFASMNIDPDFKERFLGNIEPYADRVTVLEGDSADVLASLDERFDFVFVDGSHAAEDVWGDGTQAWTLLKPGGLMAFDDYPWVDGANVPRDGIDRFLAEFADQLEVVHHDYQCIVRKLP